VDDEYGLDIPQLYIVNISVPEEVEKALDTRSSMGIVGNMAQYQQYQLGTSMPIAAENPAGGLAGAGVGLGLGMAMAGQMMPGQGPGGQGASATTAPQPPAPTAWHVAVNGQSAGPFNVVQLSEMAAAGQITSATTVWSAGMAGWVPAGQVPQLTHLFPQTPPPPPPPPPAA
jgi:membrane protease subunit (stomatin/prohibitin family)